MAFLYRTPVIIRYRQPYLDWANAAPGDVDYSPEDAARGDVYLGPSFETEPTLARVLDECWSDIFEEALFAWMEDEATWPSPRTREMFDEWFDAELCGSVIDVYPGEPLTDDDVDVEDVGYALDRCAWCGVELDGDAGRFVGFKVSNRKLLAHRHGRTLSLSLAGDQMVTGIVVPDGEGGARPDDDIVFKACNRDCMQALRKAVPPALKRTMREIERLLAES
jgi:hypothetical protein